MKPVWIVASVLAAVIIHALANRWEVQHADANNVVRIDRWTGRAWLLGPNASQSGAQWRSVSE